MQDASFHLAADDAGQDFRAEGALSTTAPSAKKPEPCWYVMDFSHRCWFADELTARTYLLLLRAAFDMQPGIDLFLGRDVPAKATGEQA